MCPLTPQVSVVFGTTQTSGFAEALVYGADNGAHVSSNSWGYTTAGVYESAVSLLYIRHHIFCPPSVSFTFFT